MTIKKTKDQAYTLKASLSHLGIRLKHHQALEVLAHLEGAKGWNQLVAGESNEVATVGHLTQEQRTILDEAVQRHVGAHGVPRVDEPFELVMGGDVFGEVGYLEGGYVGKGLNLEIEMALTSWNRDPDMLPLVHFLSATLVNQAGACKVKEYCLLDMDEILSRPVDIELRYNNTMCRSTCPLTREKHKPFSGVYPFLAGTWDPILEDLMPHRVWKAADEIDARTYHVEQQAQNPGSLSYLSEIHLSFAPKEGHRIRLTVGEIRDEKIKAVMQSCVAS